MTDERDLPEQVTLTTRVANAQLAVSGSETDNCLECGEKVVVSPATRRSIQAGVYPDYIVCLTCMAEAEGVDDGE